MAVRTPLLRTYLCLTLAVLALLVKLAVPVGFMPVLAGGQMWVTLCTGMGQQQMAIDVPGLASDGDALPMGADQPCSFAGGGDAMAGADPVLLAGALAFILILWLGQGAATRVATAAHLRPPLRGPPLIS